MIAKFRSGEFVYFADGELYGKIVWSQEEKGQFYYALDYDEERPYIEWIPELYLDSEATMLQKEAEHISSYAKPVQLVSNKIKKINIDKAMGVNDERDKI